MEKGRVWRGGLGFSISKLLFSVKHFGATTISVNLTLALQMSSSEADLIAKTTSYFTAWNCHDITALRTLLSTHIELHDWNLRVTGKEDVIKANVDIFDTFPNVSIDVVDTLACVSKRAVTCEIIVHLNDAANTTLTAVDVLRFNEETEICSVRAYKL